MDVPVAIFEVEFEKMKLKFQQMRHNLIEMEATLAHVKDDCKNCFQATYEPQNMNKLKKMRCQLNKTKL